MQCVASFGGAVSGLAAGDGGNGSRGEGTMASLASVPETQTAVKTSSPQLSTSASAAQCLGLDRPTDLCVSSDGLIYVVDFGSSCIRVY